ncbi:unnamed protein product, partial [Heterotrigona itama]
MSFWMLALLCITITRDIFAGPRTCPPRSNGSNNTVEIRQCSVAFFQTNTDTNNDEPHQLRSAATHVLQLRTFSPASTAGTTTRDEVETFGYIRYAPSHTSLSIGVPSSVYHRSEKKYIGESDDKERKIHASAEG